MYDKVFVGMSMNERIQELAVQIYGSAATAQEMKFAELIVQECEQVSLACSHRDDDMGAIIARNIKRHFGIKQ